ALAGGAVWVLYVSPVRIHRDPSALRGWPRAGDPGAFRAAWRVYALWTALAAAAMIAIGWLVDPEMWARARLDAIGIKLAGYLVFGLIQALIFFGFVEMRLRSIVPERLGPARHRLLVAAATALIFAAAHAPNPALIAITLGGGFAWALIFYRRPNILLLALSHAILGTILHRVIQLHMRIGPFYADPDSYILRTAIPGLSEMIGPRF
ncbi:MAG: CPBP family intramembrane metalloprotease, partial [Sphingomonadaceae bacterium]|nr:CPBP family intramembrane metalloprotease [Sphingomonadaceae bacterium]